MKHRNWITALCDRWNQIWLLLTERCSSDEELSVLIKRVYVVRAEAEFFAYTTSQMTRESQDWSAFREEVEVHSLSFPSLRPILGRIVACLDALQACRDQVLSKSASDQELYSEINPCHVHFCDLTKEVETFKSEFNKLFRAQRH